MGMLKSGYNSLLYFLGLAGMTHLDCIIFIIIFIAYVCARFIVEREESKKNRMKKELEEYNFMKEYELMKAEKKAKGGEKVCYH